MIKMQKHKILTFLLALLVSIGLWVYAVTIVNPNDVASIPDVRVRLVGSTELLTPLNILLYQLLWMVPGFLVTLWPRTV